MAERIKTILRTDALTIVAGAGYDSVQDMVESMAHGVDSHIAGTDFDICVPANEPAETAVTAHKDGRCVYAAERNIVVCPTGKILYPGFYKSPVKQGVFYNRADCTSCGCTCTREERGRRHQAPMAGEDFSKSCNDTGLSVKQVRIKADNRIIRQRKSIVEHPFGTIKRSMDAKYCLTRGLRNVAGKFSLTFLAYNIKRAINILGCKKLVECMTR
jgi:hypothetical protein